MRKTTLKYLYLSSDKFPPFRVDVNVLFGKKLFTKGHEIDWILQSDDDKDKSEVIEWSGGRVFVGSTNNRGNTFSKISKYLRDIKNDMLVFSLAKKENYDFIQVKDKFIAAIFAILSIRNTNSKFFFWVSYPFPEAYLYRYKEGTARYPMLNLLRGCFFKWLLYKYIVVHADHIFVQSEQMKRDFIKEGVSANKLTSVPMGVEISSVPYHSNEKFKGKLNPTVVYLGTLTRVRRMDFLVRAFAVTKEKIPDAKLYFVGSGDYESDTQFLLEAVEEGGLMDSVEFTGFLPMEKAWEYVRQADVCVSPFYPTPILNSTSPTKLIEYMAMGKAVVANDHPEQSLVISESGAGICVPYNEKEFGEAIAVLLKDDKKARVMGEKGRYYALKNRSYDVIADKLEATYRSILSKSA